MARRQAGRRQKIEGSGEPGAQLPAQALSGPESPGELQGMQEPQAKAETQALPEQAAGELRPEQALHEEPEEQAPVEAGQERQAPQPAAPPNGQEPLTQPATQELAEGLGRLERQAEELLLATRELGERTRRGGRPGRVPFFEALAKCLPDVPWRRVKLPFLIFLFLCTLLVVLCRVNIGVFNNIKDLDFRHNEVTLAFEKGVNSYRVWHHELEVPPWRSLDNMDWIEAHNNGALNVHVYPPWHTTFFWWYGLLERGTVVKLFQWLYVAILSLTFLYLLYYRPRSVVGNLAFLFGILGGCFTAAACCFDAINYGILFMPALVVIYEVFKREGAAFGGVVRPAHRLRAVLCEVAMGLALALIMVKPQVGALFFFPLLFGRRFLAVGVALLTLLLASLWPAHLFGESPLELVKQTVAAGNILDDWWCGFAKYVNRLAWREGVMQWSILCGFTCAVLSWLLRRHPSHMVRLSPALLFFPVWTYGNMADFVLVWPLLALVLLTLFDRGPALISGGEKLLVAVLLCGTMLKILHFCQVFGLFGYLSSPVQDSTVNTCVFVSWVCKFLLAAYFAGLFVSRQGEVNPKWAERAF